MKRKWKRFIVTGLCLVITGLMFTTAEIHGEAPEGQGFKMVGNAPTFNLTKSIKVAFDNGTDYGLPPTGQFKFHIEPYANPSLPSPIKGVEVQKGPEYGLGTYTMDEGGAEPKFDTSTMLTPEIDFYEDIDPAQIEGEDSELSLDPSKFFNFNLKTQCWYKSIPLAVNIEAFSGDEYGVGVYRFLISEERFDDSGEGYVDGLIYTLDKYLVDVYKMKDESKNDYVYQISMYLIEGGLWNLQDETLLQDSNKRSEANFINDWSWGDGNYGERYVILNNNITGNLSNPQKEFTYEIKVKSDVDEYYRYQDQTGKFRIFKSNSSETVKLKANGGITIYGLSLHDEISVTQKDETDDGYITSVNYKNIIEYGYPQSEQTKLDVHISNLTASMLISYTNDKNIEGPTGLMIEYGPYAAVLAAGFVVAGIVWRKRRRADN